MAHNHEHAPVSADSDTRWLKLALALIVTFMAGEVVVGLLANSLALLSDAAHMLTDAAALALALVAIRVGARPSRGRYTFGLKRAEILSAQANGASLLLLAAWLVYEAIHRLITPDDVRGGLVLVTALVGVAVNIAAAWAVSKANRSSLNVEGAFQHILTDLYAFIATAVAGLVVLLTGFARADAIATLIVAALMIKAGAQLVRDSSRVLLEAAPAGIDPAAMGRQLARVTGVLEVHDLHVWELTSGYPALSAHVTVLPGCASDDVRRSIEQILKSDYDIDHTTLQVDTAGATASTPSGAMTDDHCQNAHGDSYRASDQHPASDNGDKSWNGLPSSGV